MTSSEISNGFSLILLILTLFNVTFEVQGVLRAERDRKMISKWCGYKEFYY
jgi:hypothetical protein